MAVVNLLSPLDHFSGTRRLLPILIDRLGNNHLTSFRLAVAFAKSGPLVKLCSALGAWRGAGKTSQAIIGVNNKGTSEQALRLSLKVFDEVYVCFPGRHSTFHPKIFLFSGGERAFVYYGSHNLTGGGTETNLEAGVEIELERPADDAFLASAVASLDALLPANCSFTRKLDNVLLAALIAKDMLYDESKPTTRFGTGKAGAPGAAPLFPLVYPKPPMPIPKASLPAVAAPAAPIVPAAAGAPVPAPGGLAPVPAGVVGGPVAVMAIQPPIVPSDSFVIQIVPHHNGEVFLSKIAVNQNPAFFGFPFTGATVPKIGGNASYPQRVPDPVVDIVIYDAAGAVAVAKAAYPVNTVYYQQKGEIRITFSPDLTIAITPFSILHMQGGDSARDYYFEIFNPGSPRYIALLAACNQTLPSGGNAVSRKMGWL